MLRVTKLSKAFGGVKALTDLDLSLDTGEILGLIGPNGSGKTTTVNVLTGVYRASGGSVVMDGVDVTTKKPEQIARSGVARTFQNLRIFKTQSVLDNVRIGQSIHCTSFFARLNAVKTGAEKARSLEADQLIARFSLADRKQWEADSLSYGEKKRLEIARALAMRPKILLLDEPAAGMNAVEVDKLMHIIRSIRDSGIGIPSDQLESIFAPFIQVGRTLATPKEGTGLGLAISRDLARAMGGDLSDAPQGKSPTFLVAALKDAIGANLDRIQIVKGWLDKDGKTQERVYDVVVSGGRAIDADGRCKTAVGSTVDVDNATWTNTIGAPELITVWKDPQFDAGQRAFYYARVIEIPTPRWTAYDAKYYGLKLPPEVPMIHNERAYTSPIWYTPAK